MKALQPRVFVIIPGGCAVLALLLVAVPISAGAPVKPAPSPVYAGANHVTLRGSPVKTLPIRLESVSSQGATAPEPTVSVPTLVGVAGRQAYLKSTQSGEVERLGIGAELDGWKLVAVGSRSVTLRGAAGDRRIAMFERPAEASAPIPAGAPPPTGG